MHTTLIEPAQLAASLDDPHWRVIDCRFDLARPAWGAESHAEGHVPRAVYAHLDRDLSGPVTSHSGRHPLPDVARFALTLGSWGIDADSQVVTYDQANGAYAARLWWMLRSLGHHAVAVLDGGFAAWRRADLPVSRDMTPPAVRQFIPRTASWQVVTTRQIHETLGQGTMTVVDARGADRFAGLNETIDPVAGHIPGALNHPFTGNVDAQGRFLPAQQLRDNWLRTLADRPTAQVVSMCGSGVTACQNLLALEVAGLPGARLYGGSWSEWIRAPVRPVAPDHS